MILDIQGAIYSALVNSTPLDALLARARDMAGNTYTTAAIYDKPPQPIDSANNDYFPFVTIGNDDFLTYDTDDSNGFDGTLNIHTWSRYSGRVQAKNIQNAIYNALHKQDITVTGASMINLTQEFSTTMIDPDGQTYHGVQRFRMLIEIV